MALQVTNSNKDENGDIIGLCGYSWRHTKSQAISNIQNDAGYYYVSVGGYTATVRIGQRNGRPYLTTSKDDSSSNNLDNLTDC